MAATSANAANFRSDTAFIASEKGAIAEQSQVAKGDLNGDGLEDVVDASVQILSRRVAADWPENRIPRTLR
jgi:hypothetical protein